MAEQLRRGIYQLVEYKDPADVETRNSYELYETQKDKDESEANFHYGCYQAWS
jgi:hypothetical protein